MNRGYVINRGHYLKRFVINIRASKNISGLVKVAVTSPAGLMKFFLNVEPWSADAFLFFQNKQGISLYNKPLNVEKNS